MKELFYAGLQLQKDLRMCAIYDELEAADDVIILSSGRRCVIHEMIYTGRGTDREDTGKTHFGFEFHYITVYCNGAIFNIEPASYYPFTDENDPGEINFIAYRITDENKMKQATFREAYNGVDSIRKAAELCTRHVPISRWEPQRKRRGTNTLYDAPERNIYFNVAEVNAAKQIINDQGGFREKDILNNPHIWTEGERGNGHKIVRCAALERDADGVRRYMDIDIEQNRITG